MMIGSAASSWAQEAQESTVTEIRTTRATPSLVNFEVSSGVASFQDIQVPINEFENIRADGSTAGPEGVSRIGIPLRAQLNFRYPIQNFDLSAEGSLLHIISGMDSPRESRGSSYSRWDIGAGGGWNLNLGSRRYLRTGLSTQIRRSMFRNISSGHYIDSVMPRLEVLYSDSGWRFGVMAAIGASSKFGYHTGWGLGGGVLPNSKTSLNEWGVRLARDLSARSSIQFQFAQESADVLVEDQRVYNKLGLDVGLDEFDTPKSRQLYLSTWTALIGMNRRF